MNLFLKIRQLIIYIEKRNKVTFFFLFPFRIVTYLIGKHYLKPVNNINFRQFGNYIFFSNLNPSNQLSLISAGIANTIDFELNIHEFLNFNKIILIDPTKESDLFLKKIKKDNNKFNFNFINKALSTKSGISKIHKPIKVQGNLNYSLDNLYGTKETIEVDLISLDDVLKIYNIEDDFLLKLDIEGVEDIVLIDLIKKNIFPKFICFEMARNFSILRQLEYYKRLIKVIKFVGNYYDLYNITTIKLGYRIEILGKLKNK